MLLIKTRAGEQALEDRRARLSSSQRMAFSLFDGKHTMGEVLAATAVMGITQHDVHDMIAQGLLMPLSGRHAAARPAAVPALELELEMELEPQLEPQSQPAAPGP